MLYVTTRNNRDVFTAQHALRENRGPDGGFYLPFRMPKFSPEELHAFEEKTFNTCVAEMMNMMFGTRLSGWDVDFCVGRYPVRLTNLRHRIIMTETWHNPQWNYAWMAQSLVDHIRADADAGIPGDWVRIGVRIAVLFGIFAELKRAGIQQAVDISVVSGDFSAPMSAWYARSWGLPIGNIICCCNENKNLWDLICHGQLRTDSVSIRTSIPEADTALPVDLERLIYDCGGVPEVEKYLEVSRRGGMYCPSDALLSRLREGLFVSVVSTQRMETTIPSVYRTHDYLLSPSTALAYAGLLDYRAKTGHTRYALVLSEKGPICDAEIVAKSLSVSTEELKKYF